MYGIFHEGEITCLFPVAVDVRSGLIQGGFHEKRDDRRVGTVGALVRAKDVEVAQPHDLHTVGFGEDPGIELVRLLADSIR